MEYALARDFDRTLVVFRTDGREDNTYVRLIEMNTEEARNNYDAVFEGLRRLRRHVDPDHVNRHVEIVAIVPYSEASIAYDAGPRAFTPKTVKREEVIVHERKVFK